MRWGSVSMSLGMGRDVKERVRVKFSSNLGAVEGRGRRLPRCHHLHRLLPRVALFIGVD
jgi:hypothetical protein